MPLAPKPIQPAVAADYDDRPGFDEDFLGERHCIALPRLTGAVPWHGCSILGSTTILTAPRAFRSATVGTNARIGLDLFVAHLTEGI
jgi:hypothetical protein